MSKKHSVAPWTYESDEDFYNDTDGTRFVDLNGDPDQTKSRYARVDAGPTSQADAILIAAAPDLLAALEQIVSDWDSVDPNELVPDNINTDEHWESARDAIRKAKSSGESAPHRTGGGMPWDAKGNSEGI